MTNRQVRELFKEISPQPGFILTLSKNELADLVYDYTKLELESYSTSSNAKRLEALLLTESDNITKPLVEHLLILKEQ